MAAATRTVRRLRLRAPSEAAVRRTVLVLEDALRTATLPDAGGRMLFVRRLALGRLMADAQPVSVALALEKAMARVGVEWLHGEDAGAAAAPAVWFRDPLEAHVALARRVLDGMRPEAWYWPLAVPAWHRGMPRAEAARAIAYSLAARAEAPVAVPRWFAELMGSGYGGGLAAALRAEDVAPLARAARVRLDRTRGVTAQVGMGAERSPQAAAAPAFARGADEVRRLIEGMLRADSGLPARHSIPTLTVAPAPPPIRPIAAHPRRDLPPTDASVLTVRSATGRGASPADKASPASGLAGIDTTDPRNWRPEAVQGSSGAGAAGQGGSPRAGKPPQGGNLSPAWMAPTSAGGLLFLLNALECAGYPEWLGRQPEWEPQQVARRLLARVLERLAVPAEDPAWEMARDRSALPRSPRRFVAPRRWREGLLTGRGAPLHATEGGEERLYDASGRLLLGGWRGPCPRPLLFDRRRAAASPRPPAELTEEVIGAWEVAVRRWLRRCGGVGMAELVLRSGAVAATPTHLDCHFDLAAADPLIRRAGLDLDPGWVWWFGRVVAFHYDPGGIS